MGNGRLDGTLDRLQIYIFTAINRQKVERFGSHEKEREEVHGQTTQSMESVKMNHRHGSIQITVYTIKVVCLSNFTKK